MNYFVQRTSVTKFSYYLTFNKSPEPERKINMYYEAVFRIHDISVWIQVTIHLHYFSKIKSQKESKNRKIQGFLLKIFLHDDRRIGIRIRKAKKHVNTVDPD